MRHGLGFAPPYKDGRHPMVEEGDSREDIQLVITLKFNGTQNLLVRSTVAFVGIKHFEYHFTLEYCGYGRL